MGPFVAGALRKGIPVGAHNAALTGCLEDNWHDTESKTLYRLLSNSSLPSPNMAPKSGAATFPFTLTYLGTLAVGARMLVGQLAACTFLLAPRGAGQAHSPAHFRVFSC